MAMDGTIMELDEERRWLQAESGVSSVREDHPRQQHIRLWRFSVAAGLLSAALVGLSVYSLASGSGTGRTSAVAGPGVRQRDIDALQAKFDGEDEYCGNSPDLNDFSSKRGMEEAGWWFNWTDDFTFKPLMYKDFVPPDSYWGFQMHGSGAISLRVKGEGTLTLDFGNLLATHGSKVQVFLNLAEKADAGPSVISKTVDIDYQDDDVLTIVQVHTGIIVLNRISFECASAAGQKAEPSAKKGDATSEWRAAHEKLQRAQRLEETKEQEHYAAKKLETAAEKALKHDESERAAEQEEANALTEREKEDLQENDRLVHALKHLDIWNSGGQSDEVSAILDDMIATVRSKSMSTSEKALAEAKLEEKLAKAVSAAAEASQNSEANEEQLQQAKQLLREAQEDQRRAEKALEEGKKLQEEETGLTRNETWAKHLIAQAKEQAKKTEEELKEAEQKREEDANQSEKAAKHVADTMVVEPEEEKPPKNRVGFSLYCFTLMLPFGGEPGLLAAQRHKNVGMFECDEWTVFSNSTTLLGTDEPLFERIELLNFSLAVPYGGRWHTAMNTPIFNKIWARVVDMGIYLKHDWVVKADIDTVWFPTRLRDLLRGGLPGVPQVQAERRLKKELGNPNCTHCRLRGKEFYTCEDSVKWLQGTKGLTCDEALEKAARPPPEDCGCQCSRLEVCDLAQDHNWNVDARTISGDFKDEPKRPAIYINNCRFGLHGPIEVLSSGAVSAYVENLHKCDFLLSQAWGEDKFLDRCMMSLGVTRVNAFGLLNETACHEEPTPCIGTNVAFHPYKKLPEYMACWTMARNKGHGPVLSEDQRSFV
mmetsp:Transcript_27775/g.59121  ORF Transcript_27775/g.59121 Transcript_27775/m.59121 type:complete len:822 (-) Transcript_27775:266-2731(-)